MAKSSYLRGIQPLPAELLRAITGRLEPPPGKGVALRRAINQRIRAIRAARAAHEKANDIIVVEEPYRG